MCYVSRRFDDLAETRFYQLHIAIVSDERWKSSRSLSACRLISAVRNNGDGFVGRFHSVDFSPPFLVAQRVGGERQLAYARDQSGRTRATRINDHQQHDDSLFLARRDKSRDAARRHSRRAKRVEAPARFARGPLDSLFTIASDATTAMSVVA